MARTPGRPARRADRRAPATAVWTSEVLKRRLSEGNELHVKEIDDYVAKALISKKVVGD